MRTTNLELRHQPTDAETARLRLLIGEIEDELMRLPASAESAVGRSSRLVQSWGEVVKLLDLGPGPDIRECHVCGNVGLRSATLCGYCWTRLPTAVPA